MKYPDADQTNIRNLVRCLDTEKKGLIPFIGFMEFIENNTTLPAFPDADEICEKIAKAIVNDKHKKISEFFAELNIKEKDFISVRDFLERIGKPFGVTGKNAYYVYYKIKPITEQKISGGTLQNILESQLEEDDHAEQDNQNKEVAAIEESPEDLNKELAVGFVKLYNLVFSETSKKRMSEHLVFEMIDTDKSKSLGKFELKEGLKKIGLQLSDKEVEEMIIFADTNKDGKIAFQEFLNAINKVRKKISPPVKTEAKPLSEDELYISGLEKLNRDARAHEKGVNSFDSYFCGRFTTFLTIFPVFLFKKAIRDLNIGLTEEEIK